jgi:hypothetical protein
MNSPRINPRDEPNVLSSLNVFRPKLIYLHITSNVVLRGYMDHDSLGSNSCKISTFPFLSEEASKLEKLRPCTQFFLSQIAFPSSEAFDTGLSVTFLNKSL